MSSSGLPEAGGAAVVRRSRAALGGSVVSECRGGLVGATWARLLEGRLVRLVHDSAGAFFLVGVEFKEQPVNPRAKRDELAGYDLDFSRKAAPIELVPGSWLVRVLEGEPWRSPMDVVQAALGFWDRHLVGEPDAAPSFLKLSDWLLRYGDHVDGGIKWRHGYPVPKYGLTPGWISGLTQGQALSVLTRAHALSGEERYLEAARLGLVPIAADVADGGVGREIDAGFVIEEYPTAPLTAVLNGWVFAHFGLHDLALADPDGDAPALLARSRAALLELLPQYDAGWWSRYSLGAHGRSDLAKPFYQRLHTALLTALDRIDPDPRLREMAARWEAQMTPLGMARIAVDKTVFRFARRDVPAAVPPTG